MNLKVGIPRGMFYFDYHILWEEFFNNLGVEVVVSPKTNKDIMDLGVKLCVDEACLPVKVFHGHVDYLKNKVDYIFIPKITSVHIKEYGCPKHLGLPEMVKNTINDLPPIIDIDVNLRRSNRRLKKIVVETGKYFEKSPRKIWNAFRYASDTYEKTLYPSNLNKMDFKKKILLLGHPYNIYDEYISMNIANKLKRIGFYVLTVEMIEEEKVRHYAHNLPKRMFWSCGQRILGGAFSYVEEKSISGIIYVSAFGCGLDSVLIDLVERKAKEKGVPFSLITIDEQTGEAGVNTRIEAFTDMLDWRVDYEDNISTYG